ncbi:hypothetical protein BC829DRAFT_401213 [Chytridium lagenaria]|nr:hypothetical protein BC829DRAFT_401213 [Chytridium lagenaria]
MARLEVQKEVDKLKGREEELLGRIGEMEKKVGEVEEETKKVVVAKEGVEMDLAKQRENFGALLRRAKEVEVALETARTKATDLQGQVDDLTLRSEQMRDAYEGRVEEVMRREVDARESYETERRNNLVLNSQLESLRRTAVDLEKRLRESTMRSDERLQKMSEMEFELATAISGKETFKEQLEEEVEKLKGVLGEMRETRERAEKVEGEVEDLRSLTAHLQMEIEVKEMELTALRQEVKAFGGLEEMMAKGEGQVGMRSMGNEETPLAKQVEMEVERLREERARLLSEVEVVRKRVTQIEGLRSDDVRRYETANAEANAAAAVLHGRIGELEKRVAEAEREVVEGRKGVVKEVEIEEIRRRFEVVERERDLMADEVVRGREEMKKVETVWKEEKERLEKEVGEVRERSEAGVKAAGDEIARVKGEAVEAKDRLEVAVRLHESEMGLMKSAVGDLKKVVKELEKKIEEGEMEKREAEEVGREMVRKTEEEGKLRVKAVEEEGERKSKEVKEEGDRRVKEAKEEGDRRVEEVELRLGEEMKVKMEEAEKAVKALMEKALRERVKVLEEELKTLKEKGLKELEEFSAEKLKFGKEVEDLRFAVVRIQLEKGTLVKELETVKEGEGAAELKCLEEKEVLRRVIENEKEIVRAEREMTEIVDEVKKERDALKETVEMVSRDRDEMKETVESQKQLLVSMSSTSLQMERGLTNESGNIISQGNEGKLIKDVNTLI